MENLEDLQGLGKIKKEYGVGTQRNFRICFERETWKYSGERARMNGKSEKELELEKRLKNALSLRLGEI